MLGKTAASIAFDWTELFVFLIAVFTLWTLLQWTSPHPSLRLLCHGPFVSTLEDLYFCSFPVGAFLQCPYFAVHSMLLCINAVLRSSSSNTTPHQHLHSQFLACANWLSDHSSLHNSRVKWSGDTCKLKLVSWQHAKHSRALGLIYILKAGQAACGWNPVSNHYWPFCDSSVTTSCLCPYGLIKCSWHRWTDFKEMNTEWWQFQHLSNQILSHCLRTVDSDINPWG